MSNKSWEIGTFSFFLPLQTLAHKPIWYSEDASYVRQRLALIMELLTEFPNGNVQSSGCRTSPRIPFVENHKMENEREKVLVHSARGERKRARETLAKPKLTSDVCCALA